jgi:hypothetical protein
MAKAIVGIHGLANKPEESVLKEWWEALIREGLKKNEGIDSTDFKFQMVHWACLLYKYPLHDETNFLFDKLYNDEPYVEAAEGVLQKYDDSFLNKVRAGVFDIVGDAADALRYLERSDPGFELSHFVTIGAPRKCQRM